MLTIRQSQMAVLRDTLLESFRRKLADHLRANFPACADMHPVELDAFVAHGVARAGRYGIVVERDICKFLNTMVVFGRDFDVKCAWAKEVLAQNTGARLRLNRLYARAIRAAHAEAKS
jgi:hypothetical protein